MSCYIDLEDEGNIGIELMKTHRLIDDVESYMEFDKRIFLEQKARCPELLFSDFCDSL